MKKHIIRDATLIGEWQDVKDLPLSAVTKRDADTAKLDGLVIRGYETKFNAVNENGEKYDPHCLDDFIQSYFVAHRLNMVVDLQHGWGVDDQVGRVIYMETNTTGFYFVAYIPRRVARFEQVKTLIEEGILQGFSKCGWATDYEWKKGKDGQEYMLVKKMDIVSVSLVTAPANAIPFEATAEAIRNELTYRNRIAEAETKKSILKSKSR